MLWALAGYYQLTALGGQAKPSQAHKYSTEWYTAHGIAEADRVLAVRAIGHRATSPLWTGGTLPHCEHT